MRMAQEGAESIAPHCTLSQATSSAARYERRRPAHENPDKAAGCSLHGCAVLNTCRIGNDVQLRSILSRVLAPSVPGGDLRNLRFADQARRVERAADAVHNATALKSLLRASMSTDTSRTAVASPLSSRSEMNAEHAASMNAEHAASWERWNAAGAASGRRTQAAMRAVALAIGLGLAAWALVLVVMW
jgi:hypothetical protein